MKKEKRLFTVSQLAQIAGVSLSAIYKQWPQNFPTSYKIGTVHVISRQDVQAYLNKQGAGAAFRLEQFESEEVE